MQRLRAATRATAGRTRVSAKRGSHGRGDMTVRVGNRVLVFEFKVPKNTGPGAAMRQLEERGYAQKYFAYGTTVVRIVAPPEDGTHDKRRT